MEGDQAHPTHEALALPADDGDGWPSFDLDSVLAMPEDALRRLDGDIEAAGGLAPPDPEREGAAGFTMFDSPGSEDNSVTVLLADSHIVDVPLQSLVRIKSKDGRRYLGTVVSGPFAESPRSRRSPSTSWRRRRIPSIRLRDTEIHIPGSWHGRLGRSRIPSIRLRDTESSWSRRHSTTCTSAASLRSASGILKEERRRR